MKRNGISAIAAAILSAGLHIGSSISAPFGLGRRSSQKRDVVAADDKVVGDSDKLPTFDEFAGSVAKENQRPAETRQLVSSYAPPKSKATLQRRALRKRGNSSRKYNRQRARLLRDARKERRLNKEDNRIYRAFASAHSCLALAS